MILRQDWLSNIGCFGQQYTTAAFTYHTPPRRTEVQIVTLNYVPQGQSSQNF